MIIFWDVLAVSAASSVNGWMMFDIMCLTGGGLFPFD